MSKLTSGLVILFLFFICTSSGKNCGDESLYYEEKDIEILRCILDKLENTSNQTVPIISDESGLFGDNNRIRPAALLEITRDQVINPEFEDIFPEVYCKKCNLKLQENLAVVVKCYQCIDTVSRTPGATQFKKVYIY